MDKPTLHQNLFCFLFFPLWLLIACTPDLGSTGQGDNDDAAPGQTPSDPYHELTINGLPTINAIRGYLAYTVVPQEWWYPLMAQIPNGASFNRFNILGHIQQGWVPQVTRASYQFTFAPGMQPYTFNAENATVWQNNVQLARIARPIGPTANYRYTNWSSLDAEIVEHNSEVALLTPAPYLNPGDRYFLLWLLIVEERSGNSIILHLNNMHIDHFTYQLQ